MRNSASLCLQWGNGTFGLFAWFQIFFTSSIEETHRFDQGLRYSHANWQSITSYHSGGAIGV